MGAERIDEGFVLAREAQEQVGGSAAGRQGDVAWSRGERRTDAGVHM